MNDILFCNNNSEVITKLSKRYFKKNKVRNLAALLAIILTAFLFTSITSLAFNMASSIQLSLQMQKGSKADGTLGYMTEEQYEQRFCGPGRTPAYHWLCKQYFQPFH